MHGEVRVSGGDSGLAAWVGGSSGEAGAGVGAAGGVEAPLEEPLEDLALGVLLAPI